MANALDVIVPIIVAFIIVAVSLYLFTIYCHPEEKGFGNELMPKILVILSQTLAWGQILILPLDLGVGGAATGNTFYLVYYILYPIIFVLIAFVNPFAMFFYQADEEDSMAKRIFWPILYAFIIGTIWVAFVFISYVWIGNYSIDGIDYRINAAIYVFLALSLVGWVMLALNGAVGIIFLPFDLIAYFVNKPTPMTSSQALDKKKSIEAQSSELVSEGQRLKQQSEELEHFQGSWFSKKRNQSKFDSLLQKYRQKIAKLQENYQLFTNDLERKTRHPIVYVVSLLFGIISVVISIFWVFQILGHIIQQNSNSLYSFIDSWLAGLSTSGGSFLATLLYGALVIYMEICLSKGNTTFGFRIPFIIKVHPMIVNKTYMNSLLFNSNLMLLASCSISFQALWTFPQYFTPSQSYLASIYATQITRLPLFGSLYGKMIPLIVMQILTLVVLIFVIVRAVWRHCTGKDKDSSSQQQSTKKVKS